MLNPNKAVLFFIGLSMLLTSLELAQGAGKPPRHRYEEIKNVPWGKPTKGVACAITLEQPADACYVDQPILVRFHAKNSSSKSIGVYSPNAVRNIFFRVEYHLSGPNKNPSPISWNGVSHKNIDKHSIYKGTGRELRPGQSYHDTELVWLNRYFDMTLSGTYQIFIKRKIILLADNKREEISVTSNSLEIKVQEPAKSRKNSAPKEAKLQWSKPVEGISCSISSNVRENTFKISEPIWLNLHTRTENGKRSKSIAAGDYEISVLAPYRYIHTERNGKVERIVVDTQKTDLKPMRLTQYGLQQTKGKDKSTLHITLTPKEKEDFIRIQLNRYFDMPVFSNAWRMGPHFEEIFQVLFKRKIRLPNRKEPVIIESDKFQFHRKPDKFIEEKK